MALVVKYDGALSETDPFTVIAVNKATSRIKGIQQSNDRVMPSDNASTKHIRVPSALYGAILAEPNKAYICKIKGQTLEITVTDTPPPDEPI